MGVVDFDPEKWRQANASPAPAEVAKVAKLAEVDGKNPKLSQLSQLSQARPLPEGLRSGLIRLRDMACPDRAPGDVWVRSVADALAIAGGGWASSAMALGWSDLDLFGAVRDRDGDPAGDGLAVWLAGRRLLAITSDYAVADDGAGGRSYFNRCRTDDGAEMLWELK